MHLRRTSIPALFVIGSVTFGFGSSSALAEAPAKPTLSGVRGDMTMWIQDAETKLLELAAATPEAKFSYRPSKEARSTGEVFVHVVTANYAVPNFFGVKPPAGVKVDALEKSLTKKGDIEKALTASFAHLKGALASTSDTDLDKPAEFFGMKTTVRGGYLLLLAHAHEHLGQSIAHARANDITPPWTARRQAQAAAGKKGKAGGKAMK